MTNWRQIFSYRIEEELPKGFGRPVVAHSTEWVGKDYAGVCLYQGNDAIYGLWSGGVTDDSADFDSALEEMIELFNSKREEYLQSVREALALPVEKDQDLAVSKIQGVSFLWTVKCEFLD